jgi:hypothetical protein
VCSVLGDLHRYRRQLCDLVAAGRGGKVMLVRIEILPAARAAFGPVIDNFIQL